MAKSLFRRKDLPEDSQPPTPHQLIEKEISHLKKGTSTRYGPKNKQRSPPWLFILLLCVLGWLYAMDPIFHAWYKGEAIRTYLYLHNYGSATLVNALVASKIFNPEEVDALNARQGSFQGYYASPEAANRQANEIISYMASLKNLHTGGYKQQTDWVSKVRYVLFIKTDIGLPTDWGFLDPSVAE